MNQIQVLRMEKWLITGAGGKLGSVLLRQLVQQGMEVTGTASPDGPRPSLGRVVALDLLDEASLRVLVESADPTHVVHTAAVSEPAKAFAEPERAWRVNVELTERLARLAGERGCRMLHVSTDMVFDGEHAPYSEQDAAAPVGVYGRTKLASERAALSHGAAVVRVPLLYGLPAASRPSTFASQVEALRSERPLRLFADEVRTPLWLEDAAAALQRVALSDLEGVVHAGGPESLSRVDMGRQLATALGVSGASIVVGERSDAGSPEPRPRDLSLTSERHRSAFGVRPGRPLAEALEVIFGR